jgi:hypothetical protein
MLKSIFGRSTFILGVSKVLVNNLEKRGEEGCCFILASFATVVDVAKLAKLSHAATCHSPLAHRLCFHRFTVHSHAAARRGTSQAGAGHPEAA